MFAHKLLDSGNRLRRAAEVAVVNSLHFEKLCVRNQTRHRAPHSHSDGQIAAEVNDQRWAVDLWQKGTHIQHLHVIHNLSHRAFVRQ